MAGGSDVYVLSIPLLLLAAGTLIIIGVDKLAPDVVPIKVIINYYNNLN